MILRECGSSCKLNLCESSLARYVRARTLDTNGLCRFWLQISYAHFKQHPCCTSFEIHCFLLVNSCDSMWHVAYRTCQFTNNMAQKVNHVLALLRNFLDIIMLMLWIVIYLHTEGALYAQKGVPSWFLAVFDSKIYVCWNLKKVVNSLIH